MSEIEGDVLMYFVQAPGGTPIAAQSSSTVLSTDRLAKDFLTGKYFEAEDFTFGMALEDDEGGASEDGENRSYARWRALSPNAPKPTPPFQVEPNDVSITRMIDSSSPILLKHCLETHRFDKAVMVKRARAPNSGALSSILRMEFGKVWLKAIEWSDGDVVRETCKFKYASVSITYVKRKPDGTIASTWPCKWEGISYV